MSDSLDSLRAACVSGDRDGLEAKLSSLNRNAQEAAVDELAPLAAEHEHPRLLEYLLGIHVPKALAVRSLTYKIKSPAICAVVIAAGINVQIPYHSYGDTILAQAIEDDNLALVDYLLDPASKSGYDINRGEYENMWPTVCAATSPEMVNILVARGARLHGNVWLHYAAAEANGPVVRRLIEGGADVNENLSSDRPTFQEHIGTPLHFAVGHDGHRDESLEVVQLLLDSGADPTLKDCEGKSVLDASRVDKSMPRGHERKPWPELEALLKQHDHAGSGREK
jgi:hypothetical protein